MLWKASLSWTVPCCSVFDWLVGHAGVSASEENSTIILTNIQDLILCMCLHVNSMVLIKMKISIDVDGVINTVVGIHVNKGQTCRSLILQLCCHGC